MAVLYVLMCIVSCCKRVTLGEENINNDNNNGRVSTLKKEPVVPKASSPYALYRYTPEEYKKIGEICTQNEIQKLVNYYLSLHFQNTKKQPVNNI